MKALKYLSYVGKFAGFVSAMNVIPFVDPAVGAMIFTSATGQNGHKSSEWNRRKDSPPMKLPQSAASAEL